MVNPQLIAEQLPFDELHPTDFYSESDYDPYPDLIPAQWNTDSTEIIFTGPEGKIWLMSASGESRRIGSNLPLKENWQEDVILSWSPGGQFLLIRWGDNGWLARIHNP